MIQKFYNKLPKIVKFILREGLPLVVLILSITIEMKHLVDSNWIHFFLYNGDSLTLPILKRALVSKNPFLWVSSSQLLFFPEGLFYAISSFITTSIRASLVFNAYLNVTILYILIRCITSMFHDVSNILQRIFALSGGLLLIFYMLLERQPNINYSSVATLFLFTTYYYGIIIAGVAILGILLFQIKNTKISKKNIIIGILSFLISAMSTFSDPLFAMEFLFPLAITLLLIFIFTRVSLRKVIWLGIFPLTGGTIGYLVRIPFQYLIGQNLTSHISTSDIPLTLTVFHTALRTDMMSLYGSLEILGVFVVLLFSLIYSLVWIYRRVHNPKKLDDRLLIISLLAVLTGIVSIIFSIIIGAQTTRYLIPLIIFPILGLLPIVYMSVVRKYEKHIIMFFILLGIIISIIGLGSISRAFKLVSASTYSTPLCLANALNNKTAYGVGSYWKVRALDLYGRNNEQAFQVMSNLAFFPWQANIGSYNNQRLTFIIVDKQPSLYSILPNDIYLPPNPSKITSCNNIYIYQYSVGSKGYNILNNVVQQSYQEVKRLYSSGNLSTTTYL